MIRCRKAIKSDQKGLGGPSATAFPCRLGRSGEANRASPLERVSQKSEALQSESNRGRGSTKEGFSLQLVACFRKLLRVCSCCGCSHRSSHGGAFRHIIMCGNTQRRRSSSCSCRRCRLHCRSSRSLSFPLLGHMQRMRPKEWIASKHALLCSQLVKVIRTCDLQRFRLGQRHSESRRRTVVSVREAEGARELNVELRVSSGRCFGSAIVLVFRKVPGGQSNGWVCKWRSAERTL